LYNIRLTAGKF